jgi:uncharacterized membrane protein
MVHLTVWAFPTPFTAEVVAARVTHLCERRLLWVADAALLSWPVGKRAPKTMPLSLASRAWQLDDAFWGLLFGALFRADWLEDVSTHVLDNVEEGLSHLGINAAFLSSVRASVVAGSSALLLLLKPDMVRPVAQIMSGISFSLLETPISNDQELWLCSTFSARAG